MDREFVVLMAFAALVAVFLLGLSWELSRRRKKLFPVTPPGACAKCGHPELREKMRRPTFATYICVRCATIYHTSVPLEDKTKEAR